MVRSHQAWAGPRLVRRFALGEGAIGRANRRWTHPDGHLPRRTSPHHSRRRALWNHGAGRGREPGTGSFLAGLFGYGRPVGRWEVAAFRRRGRWGRSELLHLPAENGWLATRPIGRRPGYGTLARRELGPFGPSYHAF